MDLEEVLKDRKLLVFDLDDTERHNLSPAVTGDEYDQLLEETGYHEVQVGADNRPELYGLMIDLVKSDRDIETRQDHFSSMENEYFA